MSYWVCAVCTCGGASEEKNDNAGIAIRKADRHRTGTIVAAYPIAYHAAAMTTDDLDTRPVITTLARRHGGAKPSRVLQRARTCEGKQR